LSFGKNNDAMHQITVNDDKMTLDGATKKEEERERTKKRNKSSRGISLF